MNRLPRCSFALLLALPAVTTAADRTLFNDVTATHVPPGPELHGLDAVMMDADGDGDLDVAVAMENGANALYINDGRGKLRWKQGVFNPKAADNEHVRSADFNGDGHADLIFVAEDDRVHQLYFGDGKGGFSEHSDRLPAGSEGNGLAVGDVNGDGLPDIVVGNTSGKDEPPARVFLWLNDRKRPGHFIDASRQLPDQGNQTQGVALADMDGDGDLDLLLANEAPPNRLWINDGNGHFSDATARLQLDTPLQTREVHVLDANGDGHPDILYFNLTSNAGKWEKDPQTRLLLADGHGGFKDHSAHLPQHRFSSWGGTVLDFDGDGDQDILVSAIEVPGFTPLQVRAWRNDGTGKFSDATAEVIPASTVGRAWSMATGDVNGDGISDVFIGGWGSQARLLLGGAQASPPE